MGNAISTETTWCKGLYLFNDNLLDQMTSQATLSAVNGVGHITYSTASPPEGDFFVEIDNSAVNSAYLSVKDTSLHPSFPCKIGGSENTFTICGWFYLNKTVTSQMGSCGKWDTVGAGRGFFFSVTTAMLSRFVMGVNQGTGAQILSPASATLVAGRWYHIAGWYEKTTRSAKMSIYDATLDSVVGSARMTTSSACVGVSAALTFGCLNPGQDTHLNGAVDEWAFFTKLMNETTIESIRAGTYNPVSTAGGGGGTGGVTFSFALGLDLGRKLQT